MDYEKLRLEVAKIINPDAYWGDPQTNHEQETAFAKTDQILGLIKKKDINDVMDVVNKVFDRVKQDDLNKLEEV